MNSKWASGAVGSAREWHSRGQGFDPPLVHHFFSLTAARSDRQPDCSAVGLLLGLRKYLLAGVVAETTETRRGISVLDQQGRGTRGSAPSVSSGENGLVAR